MRGYLLYSLLVFAGFGLWLLLFLVLRGKHGRANDTAGLFLVGPLHTDLKRRGYSLTKREIAGWGIVLVLMLLAPLLSLLSEP
jgi:hypothetical protein